MLSNLSNNNSGNTTKSIVEKKKYEDIEKRIDEMQEEIYATAADVSANSQAISNLNDRVDAVEDNSTFPELNTDTINPATGDKVEITSDFDVDGEIEANSVKTNSLSVNGTNFTTVKDDAAQAKSTAESAKDKADEAYDLADAVADELADYKADNEASITTGTLNADSVVTDSIAAQTINTNDFETTNAEIDKLYVDTIEATGFLELPTAGQSYYTITVPAKTTASFSGIYTSDNNTDYPYYFTVSDGAVIYKQGSTEIIKDISFDRETGYTKVRVKSSTNLTYISSALDSNPVTIEDGGDAYNDYAFIPQKTGGYLIRGYDDTTTEVYIAGVLKAYAMSVEEEIIERTSVDFLKVNASIELPQDWDADGTISYSTGEENQYISAQTKAGVTKPTWTSPIHSTIGSLSYSSKLVDEATVASYKGISETRQTQTISITNEASLQQLTAFHWTKNGNYWQPYELTRITIGDNTMWIDPTEANQGIRFSGNQVIADGTWNDVPVEEANAVPVNLVIFDSPTELSFPITNLGDKTTVHGEITATCFKGNVLGNVTGNADTATNVTCFDSKTYAEAKADILSGCAADSNMFNGKTYSQAKANILSGNAASATNATCFDGKTYSEAKADILSGCASNANDATCFDGHTYTGAKADILSGNAASATNATCFDGKTYSEAKTDILSGTAAQAHCVDIDSLTTNSYPLVMESTTCELGKSGTCPITFTPSTGILETNQVSTSCIENSGTTKSQCLCATCDLNVDGNAYITGDLTVQGTITTTHSEEVVTPSENIILRDGATTPIASGCYSGFTVTNYDGQDNNIEVGADKDGTLHVGVVGGTMEPVATRATEACMENGYAAHWDSTGTDLVTKGATSTHDLTVNGNASVSGTLTADLTGTADNATEFDGKTYSEAKDDILSGCASNADNSTCFGGCTYAEAKADILSGNAATATNATCFNGKTYSQAKADILSGCAADSAKLGNKLPSCYIDNSSTAQTKAGNLCIGAPAACTSTSAGGAGTALCGSGVVELYTQYPRVEFHYNKYCGDYSSRVVADDSSLLLQVNDGKGCTSQSQEASYNFKSDGTFTGASKICASTNIYSAGCPVVTTGTLPTVAPGYNCTGTSNYVVTTMVCCAKTVCRNQATTGTCHLALFDNNTAVADASMNVSSACPLTYNPATGVLNVNKVCQCFDSYHAQLPSPNNTTRYITLKLGNANGYKEFTSTVDIDVFNNHVHLSVKVSTGVVTLNDISRTVDYGIRQYLLGDYDDTNKTITIYFTFTNYREANIVSSSPIVEASTSTTAPTGTFVDIPYADRTSYIGTSSDNLEFPLVFSTCCATPTSSFKTLMNDTANNLMYNPSTNTLTACCIKGNSSVLVGSPAACTSTQSGSGGVTINNNGTIESYSNTPVFDFHVNYACADYSHRLIANNGYLQVTATNATGCTAATQAANFDFCSDGTFCANKVKVGSTYTFYAPKSDNSGRPTLHLLRDITCVVCCSVCGWSAIGKACFTSLAPAAGYVVSRCVDFQALMQCGTTGTDNAQVEILSQYSNAIKPVIVTRNDGCVYFAMCATSSGNLSYDMQGACCVICEVCYNGTAYTDANGTYTITKEGSLAEITSCVSNATNSTCFGGCTYAEAKADISGSVETTPYTCINDVNSGAQNILMTSATGTLGLVNASTGTNACPLTFNPATGVLTANCFCGTAACATCVNLESWRDCDLYLVGTPHLGSTVSYDGPRRLVAAQKNNVSCLYYTYSNKNLYASGDKFTKDCQFVLSGCTLTITM